MSAIDGLNEGEGIEKAISKGLSWLQEHQFPNGEFASYIAGDAAMQGWIRPESTVFTTALIAHCLFHVKDPISDVMQELALQFLAGQMNRGGTWNHFTKYHILRNLCALDVDDTACVSALFRDKEINWPLPSNIPLLLANRNREGLFYTWFVLRLKWIPNRTYWRIALPELIRPVKSFLFWINVEAHRDDVDGVVNANALYYLGDTPETQSVINWLIKIIKDGKETECDPWYRDAFFVYYFFSRNYYAGIKKLEPIVEPIINRILAFAKPDGRFGETVLDTAWAVCSLINLHHHCPELGYAVKFLVKSQSASGNWPRWQAYYGGPKQLTGFGSEELTTAFCLEALRRYRAFEKVKPPA